MVSGKIDDLLYVAMDVGDEVLLKLRELGVGVDAELDRWEIVIRYVGNSLPNIIRGELDVQVEELIEGYCIVTCQKGDIGRIADYNDVLYIEKSHLLNLDLINFNGQVTDLKLQGSYTGAGVLIGIVDTEVDIYNEEFLDNGRNRVVSVMGSERTDYYAFANSHGTSVAMVAAGKHGVAPECELIVAPVRTVGAWGTTVSLMRSVSFCIREARRLDKPIVINISYGSNYGAHTGRDMCSMFIDAAISQWKCNVVAGAGNEGDYPIHSSGKLTSYTSQDIELSVGEYETGLSIYMWKLYYDSFDVKIITPYGEVLDIGDDLVLHTADNDMVIGFIGEPKPYTINQEIYIGLVGKDRYVTKGVWRIRLSAREIKVGSFDMWLPSGGSLSKATGWLRPDYGLTVTVPATAERVIAVGAYDRSRSLVAGFSGKGYVSLVGTNLVVKPEVVADGVNVRLHDGRVVSGTSFSAPYVSGVAALLMEWGIVRGNDAYMYGDKVKAYIGANARSVVGQEMISSISGLGIVEISDSFMVS